jgi:hypothetical protein
MPVATKKMTVAGYPMPALLGVAVVWSAYAPSVKAAEPRPQPVEFNRDIRPILSENCFSCHGPDQARRKARLRLDTEVGAFADLGGRRVLVPGKLEESELFRRITATEDEERMPPAHSGRKLTPRQVDLLRRWIEQGAKWQKHWSLVPPQRPVIPTVAKPARVHSPIDTFVLARLEREGLSPSPEADRITLIRRLSLDLLGLPPTPAEVDAFLADARPDAYEKLVDRLLDSPHYGERLAVYWLDLVRYADTVGYHGDQDRLISPYRDYVINAFNANLPFDRFTIEQLAGDLLPRPTLWQKVASGYNMLGMTTIEGGAQPREYLAKYAADRVRNASSVWLGATLGCAECHDHKFDPYATRDFYRFASFFADLREKGVYDPVADLYLTTPEKTAAIEQLDREIARLQASPDRKKHATEVAALTARKNEQLQGVRRTIPAVPVPPREMRVLKRGDWLDETGEVVQPGVPASLPLLGVAGRRATRLDLAKWLVSRGHPQTARVFVNRLWKLFFGTGLSRVLDDLGSQGEWPTHPELLDWLAVEFMDSGWDVKHLVRLLVTSNTYRQSSLVTPRLQEADPDNRLLARQARFRIDAEMVRDTALAVSGLLVRRLGGESVKPYQPAGYYQFLNFPKREYQSDVDDKQYRRGLYTHWQRTFLHPALLAFDAPSREECTAERPVSNTPQAALVLLNDPSFVEAARVLAGRTVREGGDDLRGRLSWVWRQVLSRRPSEREVDLVNELYSRHRAHYTANPLAAESVLRTGLAPAPEGLDAADLAAWTSVARALLNLNETITRN